MNNHINKNNNNNDEIVMKEKKKLNISKIIGYCSSIIFATLTLCGQFLIGLGVFGVGLISSYIVKVINSKKGGDE